MPGGFSYRGRLRSELIQVVIDVAGDEAAPVFVREFAEERMRRQRRLRAAFGKQFYELKEGFACYDTEDFQIGARIVFSRGIGESAS